MAHAHQPGCAHQPRLPHDGRAAAHTALERAAASLDASVTQWLSQPVQFKAALDIVAARAAERGESLYAIQCAPRTHAWRRRATASRDRLARPPRVTAAGTHVTAAGTHATAV